MLYIITVHGTGDRDLARTGSRLKWWENKSDFAQIINKNLKELGFDERDAQWWNCEWSGENSEKARVKGAEELKHLLTEFERKPGNDKEYLIIAHSHGGNVAIEAMAILARAGKYKETLKNIRLVLVGTPVFTIKSHPGDFLWRLFRRNISRIVLWHWYIWALFVAAAAYAVGQSGTPPTDILDINLAQLSELMSIHIPGFHTYGVGYIALSIVLMLAGPVVFIVWPEFRRAQKRSEMVKGLGRSTLRNPTTKSQNAAHRDQPLQASRPNLGKAEAGKNVFNALVRSSSTSDDSIPESSKPLDRSLTSESTGDKVQDLAPARSIQNNETGKDTSNIDDFKSVISSATVLRAEKDEAILALERIVKLKKVPFTSPSLMANITRGALAVVILAVAAVLALVQSLAPEHPPLFPLYVAMCAALLVAIIASRYLAPVFSSVVNSFLAGQIKQLALGDDHFARPIRHVSGGLHDDEAANWAYLPPDYSSKHDAHIMKGPAGQAWQTAKEALVVARFTGDERLFSAIESSSEATWEALIHTTYFSYPLVSHFIAYASLASSRTVGAFRERYEETKVKPFIFQISGDIETLDMNTQEHTPTLEALEQKFRVDFESMWPKIPFPK